MKQINDLNLATLSDGLSKVLSEELGGEFRVTVQKFERTNSSFMEQGMLLHFSVEDESWFARHRGSKGSYAIFDAPMTAEMFKRTAVRTATDTEVTYDVRALEDEQQAGMAAFLGELVSKHRDKTLPVKKPLVFRTDDKFESTEGLDGLIRELGEAGLNIEIRQPDTPAGDPQ